MGVIFETFLGERIIDIEMDSILSKKLKCTKPHDSLLKIKLGFEFIPQKKRDKSYSLKTIYLYYGHTMAKSFILCSSNSNSNPNPK